MDHLVLRRPVSSSEILVFDDPCIPENNKPNTTDITGIYNLLQNYIYDHWSIFIKH